MIGGDFKSDDDLKYNRWYKSIVKTKEGMKITTEKGTNSKIIFSCNLDLSVGRILHLH